MKLSNPTILAAIVGSLSLPYAFAGNEKGNGGGLIERNGEYLTFTAAGVKEKVTVTELEPEQLPELATLNENLENTVLLPNTAKSIRDAARPTRDRRYYKTSLAELSPAIRQQILTKYRTLMGLRPGDQVTLAAITRGTETFLFEPFFALKSRVSREAILLHETVWAMDERSKYSNVVGIEMGYEKCFTKPSAAAGKRVCPEMSRALIRNFMGEKPGMNGLQYAAMEDQALNRLPGILNEAGEIAITDLLGERFLDVNVLDPIDSTITPYLNEMHARFPKSALFYELRKSAPTLDFDGASYVATEKFRSARHEFLRNFKLKVTEINFGTTRILGGGDFTALMDHEAEYIARGSRQVFESAGGGWCINFGLIPNRNPKSFTREREISVCLTGG